MTKEEKKETGSFYTCLSISDYIAEWAINSPETTMIEPSFGDGSFLQAALKRFQSLGENHPEIYGTELRTDAFQQVSAFYPQIKCKNMDFMDYYSEGKVHAVIGNPPYVRLRNLQKDISKKYLALMNQYQVDISPNCSLWMPFMIHATELLENHGKLGFVIPYEITYVKYAFPLWKYLQKNYGKISIYRIYQDFFPEVDTETVIILAEDKGNCTEVIDYQLFQCINDLFQKKCISANCIQIQDIIDEKKPFEQALISDETMSIIEKLEEKHILEPLTQDCKFKIGYVSGNKSFFHPSAEDINNYQIQDTNLIPCLLNAKDFHGRDNSGLDTDMIQSGHALFYPIHMGKGEEKYISYGESIQVHSGYKCQHRNPWYLTQHIEIPDLVLTVFGDIPKLMINSKGYAVSNSLLCGTLIKDKNISAKEFICRWYNSLTLLLIETYIHSLGGGTLVIIPGEIDKLKMLSQFPKESVDSVFEQLNQCMISGGLKATYNRGDELVLKQIYHFQDDDIHSLHQAIDKMKTWRSPDLRRN